MKLLQTFKLLCLSMLVLILFQNCKMYQSKISTVDLAISSSKNLKVTMVDGEIYSFCRLIKKENKLYGITKINSATGRKLDSLIERCSVNGKIAKIRLFEDEIKEIHLAK